MAISHPKAVNPLSAPPSTLRRLWTNDFRMIARKKRLGARDSDTGIPRQHGGRSALEQTAVAIRILSEAELRVNGG